MIAITLGPAGADRAQAALVTFQSFSGNVGLSTDGWGGLSQSGVISASVPDGSTVTAAYLYTGTYGTLDFSTGNFFVPTAVTLDGASVSYATSGQLPSPACCNLSSYRADVTDVVRSKIDGGSGGVYDFDVFEGAETGSIDGHALVVVYENAALPDASVGILDGFASVDGDTTSINFAEPLDPSAENFFADMYIGVNFSCCGQRSNIRVNGQLLTENAGNFDDGELAANGSLITVGGFDDPVSPTNPSYEDDSERYSLVDFVSQGATSITVDTFNSSRDDNIFLAAFHVSGEAGFNEPPPSQVPLPASVWLLGIGVAALARAGLRRRAA